MVNKVSKVQDWHDLVKKTQLKMVQKYFICKNGSQKIHAKEGGTLVGKKNYNGRLEIKVQSTPCYNN
jgi:hypothetical protein